MLREILEGIRRNLCLEDTVLTKYQPDHGFVNLFNSDVTNGFHVFIDEELEDILRFKVENDVFDLNKLPILKMYFFQNKSALNIEANFNSPYHKKLAKELNKLPRRGKKRKNSLARIRYAAKKIGMHSSAADICVVWRDEHSAIKG